MTNSLSSAETSACFDGPAASHSHDFDEIFLISSLISMAFCCCFSEFILTKFTTSSSEEELHELVSSVVDCASASNDIKTDRQITVNTRVKLPDLDMSA